MNRNKMITSTEEDLKRIHAKITQKLNSLQSQINSIYPDDVPEDERYIEVRLQIIKNFPEEPGTLYIHSGSPDYDQDHRGYWSSGIITANTKISELANDLKRELIDDLATRI